ncbi:30S ribosomal protein S4 [Candidatus Woesearchaeota archaeon]|nr:30S ribosomal protein S4 [Candidatus Woesearchaeota archaeon]MBW2994489.1 30S ribosomal protein S4 [Candidatus Woesearchaeota archaeon]
MGDPGKLRRKYSGPGHPWQKARIEEEKALKKEYGLKNKSEIWKQDSKLKNFANQAKRLVTLTGAQAEKERKQLLERLVRLGLVSPGATTEEVLSLSIKDILERRLQTMVYRKGLARSQTQARQYISHGHITIAGKKMKTPSYLVTKEDESQLAFVENSALANAEHPERALPEKKPEVVEVKTDDKKFGRKRVKKRTKKFVKRENKPKEGQTKK